MNQANAPEARHSTFAAVPSSVTLPALSAADPLQQRTGRWLLLISLVSGLAMAWPGLTAGPLVLDEYGTYWLAGRDNPLTLYERSLKYENIPPLAPLIHRIVMDIGGESELTLRLPSALCFLLSILFAWMLGQELTGPVGGGLTALIVAWHPNTLGEIRIARSYSPSFLLAMILFWLTIRWIRRPRRHVHLAGWSITASALIWTHYLNLAVVVAAALPLIWHFRILPLTSRFSLGAAIGIAAVAIVPLLPALLRMSIWGESFGFQEAGSLLQTLSPMWWLGCPAGMVTAWLLSRQSHQLTVARFHVRALFLWGIVPAVLAALICRGEFSSLANPRYRIGFEAAAAALLAALMCRGRSIRGAIAGTLVALLCSWAVADRYPWQLKRLQSHRAPQWKQLAQHLEEHAATGEPVFVQSGLGEGFLVPDLFEDAVFLDYAACRMGRFYLRSEHPRYGLPFLWRYGSPTWIFFENLINKQAQRDSAVIWLVAATDTDLNVASMEGFQLLLQKGGFQPVNSIQLSAVTLFEYRLRPADDTRIAP